MGVWWSRGTPCWGSCLLTLLEPVIRIWRDEFDAAIIYQVMDKLQGNHKDSAVPGASPTSRPKSLKVRTVSRIFGGKKNHLERMVSNPNFPASL